MQGSDDKEQEDVLLQYIDIPYFRNNPAYIDKWRSHYQKSRDPQILLLMYHKQISTYFHWIYLELSAHFLRIQQPEISHFVLSEALRARVYDGAKIRKALAELPKFERKHNRGDLLALLNQRNIKALGRVWNNFEEEFVYETHLQGFPNFEFMKLCHYESRYGVMLDIPENVDINTSLVEVPDAGVFSRILVNSKPLEMEDASDGTVVQNNADNSAVQDLTISEMTESIDTINKDEMINEHLPALTLEDGGDSSHCSSEPALDPERSLSDMMPIESHLSMSQEEKTSSSQIGLSSSFVGTQEIEIQSMDPEAQSKRNKTDDEYFKSMFEQGFLQISGNLVPDAEVLIGRYIYLIQQDEAEGFSLLRIARDSDITQTIIGKHYLLRRATYQNAKISRELFGYECCEYEDKHFVLYEHSRIAHVSCIVSNASSIVCLFYLRKITGKLLSLLEKGFLHLDPTNFFVDQNFDVVFNSFEFASVSEEVLCRIERKLQDAFRNSEVRLSQEFLCLADSRLDLGPSKRDILKHKTEILEVF